MLTAVDNIELIINGRSERSRARTLADLVAEQNLAETSVATALNGEFVSQTRRASTILAAGDRVEIVSPRQGG